MSIQTFDPWFVGVIGAAGVLTALVPGSMILVSAATLLANDVLRPLLPDLADDKVTLTARGLVPVIALVAVYFTLQGGQTIVALLLMGYAFVTQLFPAVICSLMARNPMTKQGAIAGIVVGVAAVAYVTLTHSTFVSLLPFLPAQSQRRQRRLRRADAERAGGGGGQPGDPAGRRPRGFAAGLIEDLVFVR